MAGRILCALALLAPLACAVANEVFFQCRFAQSPAACGFREQSRESGRAMLVRMNRDNEMGVRLLTLPGDHGISGSGAAERSDLQLSQARTGCYEGREQWWAHSILFPDGYEAPPEHRPGGAWHWGVVFAFHQTGSTGQANFHVDAMPAPIGLRLRGYGGDSVDGGLFEAVLGPPRKNRWYDFVYHVRWSASGDGWFEAWVNGEKKLSHRGPTLYKGQGCYLKLSNYHTAFGKPSAVVHARVIGGTSAGLVARKPLEP